MSFNFWVNTVLEVVVPGGIGYRRELKKHRDEAYNHERDKSSVRNKHFGKEGWQQQTGADGFKYRDYSSYEEYVEHQKSKWDEIIRLSGGFDTRTTVKYRLQFFDRFKCLPELLPAKAKILCCGARQGTEVQVIRELGFEDAWGIDLNPGPANPYVREGDFMNIQESAGSLDLIYSNAVDHSFDLHRMFGEHARVLKDDGYAYYDIALQEGGVFEAVHWTSDEAVFTMLLKHFKSVEFVRIDRDRRWKSVLLRYPIRQRG